MDLVLALGSGWKYLIPLQALVTNTAFCCGRIPTTWCELSLVDLGVEQGHRSCQMHLNIAASELVLSRTSYMTNLPYK